MTRALRSPLIALLLIAVLLLASQPVPACGPFSLDAVFTFAVHPEFPLEEFARGKIGVLQTTYARSYLFAAYRNLNGVPFSPSEQKQLVALWQERLDYSSPDFDGDWPKSWLAARQTVNGVATLGGISTYRHREKPNEYETYVNCQKDAFETAANTLAQRAKKYGADSAIMRDWVAAQDEVFANCSEGAHIPAAAPADADALIRADRTYQVAAANFYAGNFDEANKSFEAIERDGSSMWRQNAAYLSARTMLRKASLGPAETKSESLSKAEATLKRILNDRGLPSTHAAAARLLTLVRLRLHPDVRLRELAQALQKKDDEGLKQDLWDYTILLDNFMPSEDSDAKPFPEALRQDDLTDWIVTVQNASEQSLNHSLERWRATSSAPWLVAALTKVTASHQEVAALMSAAETVPPSSPAFASAAFHQARLLIQTGKIEQARARLDDVLSKHKSGLSPSAVNQLLSLRLRVAGNLAEVLTFAQRVPAGFTWNEDDREVPAELSDDPDMKKTIGGTTLFDLDGARVLNEKLPLSLLQQAAMGKGLPEYLQRDVTQATWLRAVLLDEHKRAREVSPTLKLLVPALGPLVDDYLKEQTPEAMKFAGIYAWLKFPGLQPIVNAGVGRRSPLDKQDTYRDNWWCAAAIEPSASKAQGEDGAAAAAKADTAGQSPVFLSEAQKTAAKAEYARLSALGAAPNYLCREVIAWVEKHPTDPRGPEALHLAVRTTRYGCTNKETGRWSKAAYDVLHKRFPNDPWTKKTPYWFKE